MRAAVLFLVRVVAATSPDAALGAASASSLRASTAGSLEAFFAALGGEGALADVWQRAPHLWTSVSGCDRTLFSFEDAVAGAEGGLLERACVALSDRAEEGEWVSEYASPRSRRDLDAALDRGTVFFNGAGLDYPRLAALSALAQRALGLPANCNVYMTTPGRDVSVSPHTDAQDVLVFQTSGRKRWRVWPPPPRRRGVDPYGRGKNGDAIAADELGEAIFDADLEEGAVLYVPIGFPHATSTAGSDATSCHVTLGLDTYFYGLCYATLRAICLARAKSIDGVAPPDLDGATHDRLFAPLPLGFLRPDGAATADDLAAVVAKELDAVNAATAAAAGVDAPDLGGEVAVRAAIDFFTAHHAALLTETKYGGVCEPARAGTPAALYARAARNAKNAKEERLLKGLGAFARPPG